MRLPVFISRSHSMGFLSSIFNNNRRHVRDLLLADKGYELPQNEREILVQQLDSLLNLVENIHGVANCSEICDTILLRRVSDHRKIVKHLLRKQPKPFVFLINRN